jgi:hypothetical protein
LGETFYKLNSQTKVLNFFALERQERSYWHSNFITCKEGARFYKTLSRAITDIVVQMKFVIF